MSAISVKRVYEPPASADGTRILVDRLWPRGLTKEKVAADLWLKEIAPSNDLRHRFHHDPALWAQFQTAYTAELDANRPALQPLLDAIDNGKVTLLFGAQDTAHNNAVALAAYLGRLKR